MPLISCPECNSKISDKASSCPQCGFPLAFDQHKRIIGIPAIPLEIYTGLKKAATDSNFLKWNVKVGDWVKTGQEIARYQVKSFNAHHAFLGKIQTKATIVAPVSGRISRINSIEYSQWNWQDEENLDHLKDENILLFIHIIEDLHPPNAYAAYENIVDYGYFAKTQVDAMIFVNPSNYLKGSSFESDDFPKYILEALANSELKVIKAED